MKRYFSLLIHADPDQAHVVSWPLFCSCCLAPVKETEMTSIKGWQYNLPLLGMPIQLEKFPLCKNCRRHRGGTDGSVFGIVILVFFFILIGIGLFLGEKSIAAKIIGVLLLASVLRTPFYIKKIKERWFRKNPGHAGILDQSPLWHLQP